MNEDQGHQGQQRTVVLLDDALRRLRGFTAIPNAILRHPRLSYGAKVTFGVLLSYSWQDDFCWPAQERLAHDLQCSIRHVRRFLQELKTNDIINWKQQGLNRPNIYYILPQGRWAPVPEKNPERTDLSAPTRTDPSPSERTRASVHERTPMSDKEDSMKKTHNNVNVGEKSREEKGVESRPTKIPNRRRWNLTDEQLNEAEALAQTIEDEIGQPTNRVSYFVCAADAIDAGRPDIVFEALSVTKLKKRAGRIVTTPSQYFHRVFRRLLQTRKASPELEHAQAQGRAARDAFVSRSAFTDQ